MKHSRSRPSTTSFSHSATAAVFSQAVAATSATKALQASIARNGKGGDYALSSPTDCRCFFIEVTFVWLSAAAEVFPAAYRGRE
jgi:hypothetical protein